MKKPDVITELEIKKRHLRFRVLAYRKLTDEEMKTLYDTWTSQSIKNRTLKNETVEITSIIGYHNE